MFLVYRPDARASVDILTHRSGIDLLSASVLHYGLANGEGPESFARLIREYNSKEYDRVRLDYMSAARYFRVRPSPFPSFEDAGALRAPVPSASWCREVLLKLVHAMRPDLDQAVSLLSADVLAADASFKVSHCGVSLSAALTSESNRFSNTANQVKSPAARQ